MGQSDRTTCSEEIARCRGVPPPKRFAESQKAAFRRGSRGLSKAATVLGVGVATLGAGRILLGVQDPPVRAWLCFLRLA
jgi:hypothetical protein